MQSAPLFAGSSSYLEILLGTFNNSVETDATWRRASLHRFFRKTKEKKGRKKVKIKAKSSFSRADGIPDDCKTGAWRGLIIVPRDK